MMGFCCFVLLFLLFFFSSANALHSSQQKSTTTRTPLQRKKQVTIHIPKRSCRPPFPDGPCGGQLVTLSTSDDLSYNTDAAAASWWFPPRNITVWLPPNYHQTVKTKTATRQHPVLYCHDGQNAMSDEYSWTGHSWRLMGAITRLHEHGKIPHMPVVVLIPSATDDDAVGVFGMRRRHLEYGSSATTSSSSSSSTSRSRPDAAVAPWQVFAQSHVQFVTQYLQPHIMQHFQVSNNCNDHYLIGSSMGGQASLNLLLQHPHQFGGAACLSPYFGQGLLSLLQQQHHVLHDKKLYIDIGGDMNNVRVPMMEVLWDVLTTSHPGYFWLDTALQSGIEQALPYLPPKQLHYHTFPGAAHNERAWSYRMHQPLISLLAR